MGRTIHGRALCDSGKYKFELPAGSRSHYVRFPESIRPGKSVQFHFSFHTGWSHGPGNTACIDCPGACRDHCCNCTHPTRSKGVARGIRKLFNHAGPAHWRADFRFTGIWPFSTRPGATQSKSEPALTGNRARYCIQIR